MLMVRALAMPVTAGSALDPDTGHPFRMAADLSTDPVPVEEVRAELPGGDLLPVAALLLGGQVLPPADL